MYPSCSLKRAYLPKLLILLHALLFAFHVSAQIPLKDNSLSIKVEPPSWFVTDHDQVIEFLITRIGIGKAELKIEGDQIELLETTRAESPNYLFVKIRIGKEAQPGSFVIRTVVDSQKADFQVLLFEKNIKSAGIDASDLIYLITPDRFADASPNVAIDGFKDLVDREDPVGRHGGDLKGIERHLDHIAKLNFTSVWLNPVLENNMDRSSYHGYSITDFYNTDPRFGTNEEYIALARSCKQQGLKLIMDQIVNHCGSEHPWVKDRPFQDWFNYDGTFHPTNHVHANSADPHSSKIDRMLYKDGWFVRTMPDLNQRNPHLSKYLIQNSMWWVAILDLAGIRMDTYPYADETFLRDWSCALRHEFPDLFIVGEEWSMNPVSIAYWQEGSPIASPVGTCLPSLMDFPLQNRLSSIFTEKDKQSAAYKLYELLASDRVYGDPNKLVIFADNHDMDRIFTQVHSNMGHMKMVMTIIYTMRGIPQVYYGTEALLSNTKINDHGTIREEMPGGWSDHTSSIFEQTALSKNQESFLKYMQFLGGCRSSFGDLMNGEFIHFYPENGIYVYFRRTNEALLMVINNFNDSSAELDLTRFNELLGDKQALMACSDEQELKIPEKMKIPGSSSALYLVL